MGKVRLEDVKMGEEKEEPEEEWEDITEECTIEETSIHFGEVAGNHILLEIRHAGSCIALLGLNGVEMTIELEEGNYALAEDTKTAQGTIWFRVLKRKTDESIDQ